MAVLYTARQITEAAVEKEKLRRIFYATVAELSKREEMKSLFHFLTEEEDGHVDAFSKIRDRLPVGDGPDEYSEDMVTYMNSVIQDQLFSKMKSKDFIQRAIDTNNVFRLAIGFENDAILYFMKFLPHLSKLDKKIVEEVIEQEKDHIRKLEQAMNQNCERSG